MTRIGDTWGSIRGVIRKFSFAEIKDLVGAAGLPIHELAHLRQMQSGGASKGQLMDAIDGLVGNLADDARRRLVIACVYEILKRQPNAHEELETVMSRVGWGVSADGPYPLTLQIDLETADISGETRAGVAKCLARYRDGDFDGAITAICGVVDHLTAQVYNQQGLGDHRSDSYQQRVKRAFGALEGAYRDPLAQKLSVGEAGRLWQNHLSAVNQAGYVLGTFRREYSNAHGVQSAPPQVVQRAIDCAVFIVRSIVGLV